MSQINKTLVLDIEWATTKPNKLPLCSFSDKTFTYVYELQYFPPNTQIIIYQNTSRSVFVLNETNLKHTNKLITCIGIQEDIEKV
jgi:hypothetical protein